MFWQVSVAMNDAGGGWDGWRRVQCCQLEAGPHERPEKRGPVLLFRLSYIGDA